MSYIQELNALRREVRQNVAATLSYWPKALGQNIDVSTTPADNTFTVHQPDGTELQGSTNATRVSVDTDARLDLSIPAIGTLDEDYQVRITFRDSAGQRYDDQFFFNVVLVPFGEPSVTLNHLLEERASIKPILIALCNKAGFIDSASSDELKAEAAAGIFAIRARVELDAMIRGLILEDGKRGPSYTNASTERLVFTRPRAILNKERLNRVERKLACMLVYQSDANDPLEGVDESSTLYRHYRNEAGAAFKSVGPLRYDTNDDLVPDDTIANLASSIRLVRVQG